MRLAVFAATVGSVVVLVGFAETASASATEGQWGPKTALVSANYDDALPQLGLLQNGTFESSVDIDNPSWLDKAAARSGGVVIEETETINTPPLIYVVEPGEFAMLVLGVGAMLLAGRGRNR